MKGGRYCKRIRLRGPKQRSTGTIVLRERACEACEGPRSTENTGVGRLTERIPIWPLHNYTRITPPPPSPNPILNTKAPRVLDTPVAAFCDWRCCGQPPRLVCQRFRRVHTILEGSWVGMYPLLLTALNRDSSTTLLYSLLRTVRIGGNIPIHGYLQVGYWLSNNGCSRL